MTCFISKLFLAVSLFSVFTISVSAQKYVSPDAVKTTVIDAEGLKSLVKSNDKKQPILLNFWATWCGPCRVEFPDLVEIDKDYREKGLNFMVVSLDTVSLADTRVSDFLKNYEAEMPSYLLDAQTRPNITRAIRQIAPNFRGGFPFTALFDQNGKLVYQKVGVINATVLRKQIDKVLPKTVSKTTNETTQTTSNQTQAKEIVVQLTPFGYITLPKGYWAYMDANYMDAWGGLIETLDGSFKIRFWDGIIVSVFDGKNKNIKWKKELKTENYSIIYALTEDGKTKRVLAKIKSANFSTQIQNDSEIDEFLEIISRYRLGRCEKCLNSTYTKGLKKYFEKRNKND